MPYKTAVEYWTKLPPLDVKDKEVIAEVLDQRPATKVAYASVALFSETKSEDNDL